MKNISSFGSEESDKTLDELWTPNTSTQPVINLIQNVFGGQSKLDPCNNLSKSFPAETSYNSKDDGLKQLWVAETVFMHPPQSNLLAWLQKLTYHFAIEDISEAIALFPTDSICKSGCRDIIYGTCSLICLWGGGLDGTMRFTDFYGGRSRVIEIPMVFVYWGDSTERFAQAFRKFGGVWVPFE